MSIPTINMTRRLVKPRLQWQAKDNQQAEFGDWSGRVERLFRSMQDAKAA